VPTFLAVLKKMGPAGPGPLSFPLEGWTLAVDLPCQGRALCDLLDACDRDVLRAGGRVYLAKDARLPTEVFNEMYPRLDEWKRVRDRLDPEGRLSTDLGRRLGLSG
jgi:decaprenylphospho-beta-D-ribofuranose 2-oxidase